MRRRPFRLLKILAAVVIAVLLLPYLIVPLYRFVDPVSTPMVWRWLTSKRVIRTVVPIGRVAPVLPATVIAAEDGRFCSHHGVDLGEIWEAISDADDIADARGGSTITQQTAKNLFLWNGRSFIRKGLELPLALWIDLVLPKRRLLEIYLNIVEWGPNGVFGIEAGTRYAFGRSARDLTPHQAGLMAAILPNPHRRSARTPSAQIRRLAKLYEARARKAATFCLRVRGTRSVDTGRTGPGA